MTDDNPSNALIQRLDALHHQQEQTYRQIEALIGLYSQFTPRLPLPAMRRWSISPDFAVILYQHIRTHQPKRILELGGGTSTLISGYALEQVGGGEVIAVEHAATFAERIRENLRDHQLEAFAKVIHAPLQSLPLEGATWEWYDVTPLQAIGEVDLLVVDGPAQQNHPQRMIRYPALPVLFEALRPGAYVLLDDSERADEREIIARWLAAFDVIDVRDFDDTEKGARLLRKAP